MAVQTIHNPQENAVNVAVAPGQTIAFDFDLTTASFERTGNDLTISLDDGGQVALSNFFVVADLGSLPPLQLADGTQVDSGDFLAAFNVDVTPAAGAVPSNGINSYEDGAGTLIGGLGLSDSLGNTQWGGATAAGEEYQGIAAAAAAAAAGAPGTPPAPPEYRYLAVLCNDSSVPGNHPYTFNINLPGAANGDTLTIISSGLDYVSTGTLTYVDGKWTLVVSADGKLAMHNGTTVYDEIVVEYNGTLYTITVALTTDGNFSPSDAGAGFISEWHTDGNVAGRFDEIHVTGNDGTPGEVWLQGLNAVTGHNNVYQTYENTSAAASVIHVNSGVIASGANSSNTLKTGLEAESSINIHGNVKVSSGAANTIESGNITVEVGSDKGAVINSGGTNTLDAAFDVNLVSESSGSNNPAYGVSADVLGASPAAQNIITAGENIFIDVTAVGSGSDAIGLYASGSGAENRLDAGLMVTITTDSAGGESFAMYAKDNGLNVITLSDAGGEVNLTGGIYAATGGSNEIHGGTGDDVFRLNGAVSGADALIIHGNGGTDTLVLMAADSAEFISNYYDWLENGDITGITTIDVQLVGDMTSADYEAISALLSALGYTDVNYYFDSFTFSAGSDNAGSDLALIGAGYLSGGLGEQSVNIDGLGNNSTSDYNLSELAGSLQGFEHIDMSGSTNNTLTIDGLLDGLNIDTKLDAGLLNNTLGLDLTSGTALLITGDAGSDTITLGGDWGNTSAGMVTYNGQNYDVHTNSSDSSQFLLIQAGLV